MEIIKQRKCWKCQTLKPLTHEFFWVSKRNKEGFQPACIICSKQITKESNNRDREKYLKRRKEYNKSHKERNANYNKIRYAKDPQKHAKKKREYSMTPRGRFVSLLNTTKRRAKEKELEYSLTPDCLLKLFYKQNEKCAVTGLPFIFECNPNGEKIYTPFGPSIDRIDSKKGYTEDNIRLVCVMVNLAINMFGDKLFDKMCEAYIKKKNNL